MPTQCSSPLCALLLAGSALGQTSWIVDRLNGPGTDFDDLPAAVAAAVPGDTLLVRYVDPLLAAYTGTTIDKALTVVGIGGQPGIVGQLRVVLLPAGQHVQLRSLRVAPFAGPSGPVGDCQLIVSTNQGSVHLHDVDRDVSSPLAPALNQTRIESSRLVTLAECSLPGVGIGGAVLVSDCERVVMTRCRVEAAAPGLSTMRVDRSTLVLLDSEISGATAMLSCDAQMRLAGTSTIQGTIWAVVDGGAPCQSASTVTVAPTAMLGATLGSPFVIAASVVAHGAFVESSGMLTIDLAAAPGGLALLSFGEPLAQPVPLWGDLYWLDFSTVVVFDLLPLDAFGRARWQAPIGASVPAGTSLWLQTAVLEPQGFTLAPPAVAIAR